MDGARRSRRLGQHPQPGFDPAIQALLSALIREHDGWRTHEEAGRSWLALPLQGGVVEVPLREPVGVGRIAAGPARWRDGAGAGAGDGDGAGAGDGDGESEGSRPLALAELLDRLLAEPAVARAIGLEGQPARQARFVARVLASAEALAEVVSRAEIDEPACDRPLGFLAAERGLSLGHSVHPAPRLREHDGRCDLAEPTPLELWALPRERLFVGGDQAMARLDQLIAGEAAWAARAADLGGDAVLLPLHPLQSQALLADAGLAELRARGELRRLGACGRAWTPTSSLRTLHADGAPWMLKASLPVRLTNSLRTLAPAELERGVLLGRLLDETEAGALERRHRHFRILREPAYVGLSDGAGGPGLAASFVALRENPFAGDAPVEVLATLLRDHPICGRSRLALRLEAAAESSGRPAVALAERWLAGFLRAVLVPLVEAQAEFGLLLSAHQQNLVLGFADDGELAGLEPRGLWFRDAQGTAYTELALRRFGDRLPGLAAARFAAPLAERAWAYAVVVNSLFNVIASLAMLPGVAQSALLEQARACLEDLRERAPADPSALDYLLTSPQLWTKANVRCFAGGVDEVSLADPLAIYRPLANPLLRAPAGTTGLADDDGRVHRLAGYDHVDARLRWLPPRGASPWRGGRLSLAAGRHDFELRDAGARVVLRWIDPPPGVARALVHDHLFARRPELAHIVDGDDTILRETFYQQPAPWHHRGDRPAPAGRERCTSAGVDHPRRPATPAGLLYRRYCPAIDRSFELRGFDRDRDFARFCRWMHDPVVAAFWQQAWPRPRLADYIDERLGDPHVIPAIGSFDGRPFAYFEIYWAKEDRLGPHYAAADHDRGFHMAVGEAELRHRGWGRQWFLAMAHFAFLDDPRTQRLVGEPRIDQARVRSWSATTPWREWGEIDFAHKRAVLMVLTRARFFADGGVSR